MQTQKQKPTDNRPAEKREFKLNTASEFLPVPNVLEERLAKACELLAAALHESAGILRKGWTDKQTQRSVLIPPGFDQAAGTLRLDSQDLAAAVLDAFAEMMEENDGSITFPLMLQQVETAS
jgi:hypothetical protein